MSDYQEAIQAPGLCLGDGELRDARCVLNELGLPRPVCGQFATVYEMESSDGRWAVKCFLRNVGDLQERYARIAEHLAGHAAEFFMGFEMLRQGILVAGKWYPLLKMEWVEGLPLNHYVQRNLGRPRVLEDLARRWDALRVALRDHHVAHGDLQHGNVLVDGSGRLRLVDYDGMWVPAMAGTPAYEIGHPNYQSPLRTEQDIDETVDEFAGEVIAIAIRALQLGPALWARHDNGDNLLFREADLRDPAGSALFVELEGLRDGEVDQRLTALEAGLRAPPVQVPTTNKPPRRPLRARVPQTQPETDVVRAGGGAALLGRLRVFLHILGIWPAATFAALGVVASLGGDADRTITIAAPALAITAAAGLASFLSLYVIRTVHPTLCTLFFGLLAATGLVGFGAEWLARGSLVAIAEADRTHLALIAGFLSIGAVAAPIEIACHHLGVVTIWRLREV